MQNLPEKIKNAVRRLPFVRQIVDERWRLHAEIARLSSELHVYKTWVPPGHFYSPIPSLEEVKLREKQIFSDVRSKSIPGVDLNEAGQLALLKEFASYYRDLPFSKDKIVGLRYFYENPNYSYSDAIIYFCMLRHAKPKRVIEIGSGYSSCVVLDTNERFFNDDIELTFIEPYPELLLSLMQERDKERVRILSSQLQTVGIREFERLDEGDILFIDSTHVSKVGSDVNFIILEILPCLKPGVFIHFHDILFPFEYPKNWIYEGRAWNEIYLLRAFLQYNQKFKIVFFNTYLEAFHRNEFVEMMPLCLENPGGSLWLRKS